MYRKPKYKKGIRFFPTFILEDVQVICLFLAFFFSVVCFFPEWIVFGDANVPADPMTTPEHIKPEWYFLAAYQLLKIVPSKVGALFLEALAVLVIFFLPFLDRSPEKRIQRRPVFLTLVLLNLAAFIGLTLWGYLS